MELDRSKGWDQIKKYCEKTRTPWIPEWMDCGTRYFHAEREGVVFVTTGIKNGYGREARVYSNGTWEVTEYLQDTIHEVKFDGYEFHVTYRKWGQSA